MTLRILMTPGRSQNRELLINSSERRESLANDRPVACFHRDSPRSGRGEDTCNKDSSLSAGGSWHARSPPFSPLRKRGWSLPSFASARYLLFLADPADTEHRHGANVVRIAPLLFILLLRAAVIASSFDARPGGNQIGNIRQVIINATAAAAAIHSICVSLETVALGGGG